MNAAEPFTTAEELPTILQNMRAAFAAEGSASHAVRIDRLDRCLALLVDHQDAICDALDTDFGGRSRHVTRMTDLLTSIGAIKFAKKNIKKWMRPERRRAPFPMNVLGARAELHYQAKGVIGIMSPWNVPVNTVFGPLADALGAGNRAIIKPSEFAPHTASLLKKLIAEYFDANEVTVVTGDADVGAAFSALPFDHLIFTGAGPIGKLVMKAASQHLTPVTLELGGKSPVVVSHDADINDIAEKIMTGKAMNSGQLCINADYCFIPAGKMDQFISQCEKTVAEQYPTIMDNPDYVALINERNYDRISGYLDDAERKGAKIIALNPAGEDWRDREKHKIPLHLVIDPSDDMLVMQEELFGPILPIIPINSLDEGLEYINDRPSPLALYYFGNDKQKQQKVLDNTISGGVTINNVTVHVGCVDAPFGGVGNSGMGSYHGREGFKTFSHGRTVFYQGKLDLAKIYLEMNDPKGAIKLLEEAIVFGEDDVRREAKTLIDTINGR